MTFEPYLAPGERLIWSGRPRRGVRRWPNLLYTCLGVPFLVGSYLMIRAGTGGLSGEGIVFELATLAGGLVFGAFGLYLAFGVWIVDATRYRRIRYALTERAAYISNGTGIDRIPLAGHPVDSTIAEDGSGTILFGPRDKWNRNAGRASFDDIADAARVAELMEAGT